MYKLSGIQFEMQSIAQQSTYLQMQIDSKQSQVCELESIIRVNGTRESIAQYKKLCRELNVLHRRLRLNNEKITKLQFRMEKEQLRLSRQYARGRRIY